MYTESIDRPENKLISVLFARSDSVYKSFPQCDVWDLERDALNWQGGNSSIHHPPCRAWGRLRAFSNPRPGEKDLARWSVAQIRQFGGVLEHPASSSLWFDQGLPKPVAGSRDSFGGWTLPVSQHWFGHKAEKKTWLYIVGCDPQQIPLMPLYLGAASHVIQTKRTDTRPHVSRAEREHTPEPLAAWLVDLAARCKV